MKKLKPYLSYWGGGYQKEPSEYVIDLHKLSTFLCKGHYGEVHLLTDSKSEKFFTNLNFDTITVLDQLDNIPVDYQKVWSLGKLHCFNYLAKKNIQFLHVDYDVFLFKKLPEFINSANMFVQSMEKLFLYPVEKMLRKCDFKNFSQKDMPAYAYNMGIFGGRDSEFIKGYTSSSIKFVLNDKNKFFWLGYQDFSAHTAMLAEQWYLSCYAKKHQKKITPLFKRIDENTNQPFEEDCVKYGYTHLWGGKNDAKIVQEIRRILAINNI